MFGRFAKASLIASAIAPVGLVYAWAAYREGYVSWAASLIGTCLLLVFLCVFILSQAKRLLERFPLSVTSVEAADRENVSFMLLYLSPLFTAQFSQLNLNLLIPTVVIFIILTATGYNYHFNPLLGLAGWHFYRVNTTEGVIYILVTRKQLRNLSQIRQVGQLTDYILIDLGGDFAG